MLLWCSTKIKLSPLLFVIFINDLVKHISQDCRVFLYADDLKVVKNIRNVNNCFILQQNVDSVLEWCNKNHLCMNKDKCRVMSFSRKNENLSYDYTMNGVSLIRCQQFKDLGVIMDSTLSFIPHINYVTNKATRMLGFVVRNTREFQSIECILLLYYSFVRSVLEYCSIIWNPYYNIIQSV